MSNVVDLLISQDIIYNNRLVINGLNDLFPYIYY